MTHAIYLWRTQSLYDARHLCRAHAMLLGSRQCIMCSTVLRGNVSCAPPQRIMCSTVAMSHVLYRPSSFHPSLIFSLKSLQSLLAPSNVLIPSLPACLHFSHPPYFAFFLGICPEIADDRVLHTLPLMTSMCATYPPYIPSLYSATYPPSILPATAPCFISALLSQMAGIRRARVIGQWSSTSW